MRNKRKARIEITNKKIDRLRGNVEHGDRIFLPGHEINIGEAKETSEASIRLPEHHHVQFFLFCDERAPHSEGNRNYQRDARNLHQTSLSVQSLRCLQLFARSF